MSTKSLKRVHQDLVAAKNRVDLLIAVLKRNEGERRWGLGEECAKAAEGLQRLLRENQVPQHYKVAVIGRFKAGKSYFVNVLLDRRLAGVDTSPETAAITSFRYGERVLAKINLIDQKTWSDLKQLYLDDPTNREAHRVANWFKFAKERRAGGGGHAEVFDLDEIERTHLKLDGNELTISMVAATSPDAKRKAESDFHSQIRQYTSSSRPYHCLVESIEIETPSPLLEEGVTLIDTPGLEDTERFRVQLTERAVEDVDAVLFLTKSGASYGQSEKDFLLSLLRKGTIKQLIFVVTQVDHTYDQHVQQARDQDEKAQSIAQRIQAERGRLRAEIEATLNELAGATESASVARYREQINSVEIAFTSAFNHRNRLRGDPVAYPLDPDDPGGIRKIASTLYRTLSTESRLAATRRAIQSGAGSLLASLLTTIEKRRLVINGIKNREVAEDKLATFRSQFEENGKQFAEVMREDCTVLESTLANRAEQETLISELVALQADGVLASYETDDAGRHWRTRRRGRWGYMHELQTRVANRIFPKVAEELTKQSDAFSNLVQNFRAHLSKLSLEAGRSITQLDIGDELQLDIQNSLNSFVQELLNSLQEMVEGEETRITALLEQFVDESVEDKITAAREGVTDIWGTGTTASQTAEVRAFYRDVRSILKDAVKDHVNGRFISFAAHLTKQAKAIPEKALSQVRAEIDRASADIRAAAETAVAGQKDVFEKSAADITKEIFETQQTLVTLLDDDIEVANAAKLETSGVQDFSLPTEIDSSDPATIQRHATRFIERFVLKEGSQGWPFQKVFAPRYLRGATEAWLVDPYLTARHQRRNLTEFVKVLESAKLKSLHVITREIEEAGLEADKAYFKKLDHDSFERAGLRIQYSIDKGIHDRSVILNNGCVFKLGRGLDIFQPVSGLAAREPNLRRVKSCEIDVFAPST